VNNWTIAGRVGSDADVRYTGNGQAVANFSVAVDQGKTSSGEKRAPLWVKVAIWGERAEKLAQYIRKGIAVTVSGRAGVEKPWKNRDGEHVAGITLDMNQITFQSSKRDREDEETTEAPRAGGPEISDEDISF
jgi:single-strand DNA-binding protein